MKKILLIATVLLASNLLKAQSVLALLDSVRFEVIKRDIVLYRHTIEYSTTVDDELFEMCDFEKGTSVIQKTVHISCFSNPFNALHQDEVWESYIFTLNNLSTITYEEAYVLFNQYDFQQFLLLAILYKYPIFHPETKQVELTVFKGKNKEEFEIKTEIYAIIPVKFK